MYFVYVLKSLKDEKGYVGVTKNLLKRLSEHNKGFVRSTKNRKPFILAHQEQYATLSEARKREWILKCTPRGGKFKRKILEKAGVAARGA